MPTGPNCNMSWDECIAWAEKEGLDDPAAYCGARERDCKIEARQSMKFKTCFSRDVEVIDRKGGRVEAILSTETRDRDGDIIRASGWNTENFMRHPVLLSSHNYFELKSVIGMWEDVRTEGKQLRGTAKYFVGEGNKEADWAFKLVERGLGSYSVGFIPDMKMASEVEIDGGASYEFKGQELLEASQVTIPSNPDALQRMKGMKLHPVVKELLDGVTAKQEEDEEEDEDAEEQETDNVKLTLEEWMEIHNSLTHHEHTYPEDMEKQLERLISEALNNNKARL